MNTRKSLTHPQPWHLLRHQATQLTAQARQAGASALRIWSDQHLATYWLLAANTAERLESSQERYPNARRVVLEGLEYTSQSEPYWLEGNGLRVCWRVEITRDSSPSITNVPLLVG